MLWEKLLSGDLQKMLQRPPSGSAGNSFRAPARGRAFGRGGWWFKIVLLLLESLSHLPVFSLIMCEDSVIIYTFYNTARNKVGKMLLAHSVLLIVENIWIFLSRCAFPMLPGSCSRVKDQLVHRVA